jgi:hypothetical protein
MPAHFRIGFAASGERFAAAIERLGQFATGYCPSSISQPA